MFRRIVFAAAVSGLIAGLFLSAAQALRVIPLILEAETHEKASPPARAHPAGGPAFAAFSRGWILKAFGAALIALPHLIGAPQPAWHGGLAPVAMMQAFVLAALATSFFYWIVLGTLAGYFFHRFEQV